MAKKKTSAALQYLDPSFFENSPKHRAQLEEARATQEIGRLVYDLRTRSGLSAKELARSAGLSAKALEKLESGESPRTSLAQLRQVASALGQRVELKLVSAKKARTRAKAPAASKVADEKRSKRGSSPAARMRLAPGSRPPELFA
jgi:transcriptional regulator with XRE-family HTH domain